MPFLNGAYLERKALILQMPEKNGIQVIKTKSLPFFEPTRKNKRYVYHPHPNECVK
jgi:hypothetical protein